MLDQINPQSFGSIQNSQLIFTTPPQTQKAFIFKGVCVCVCVCVCVSVCGCVLFTLVGGAWGPGGRGVRGRERVGGCARETVWACVLQCVRVRMRACKGYGSE